MSNIVDLERVRRKRRIRDCVAYMDRLCIELLENPATTPGVRQLARDMFQKRFGFDYFECV
ncbi:hypothetical protein ACFSKY_14935 [Azotobacter chroococcum]|jgi:hypothetical protein|uniref:Uncharacterized protein n=1 Tax=Azotobacter chroococcum TaxID=353 RepID=A0A4R1P1G1_9GAMM|nr:hypothetical protein [Azotobacter chroococcum]NHN77885.1 hypothetical protein [Azotobacter chroococcum]TBV92189.1 hypothetical protein E0E53_19370 [Azotobacter chroococcum]TBW13177.1 hypothetical protein E0E50_00165 [Azotobacter chroococcum subsp. isscasi]TCL15411.1 hypothetical protein EV691_1636 [Azotobacter chroococcum]